MENEEINKPEWVFHKLFSSNKFGIDHTTCYTHYSMAYCYLPFHLNFRNKGIYCCINCGKRCPDFIILQERLLNGE